MEWKRKRKFKWWINIAKVWLFKGDYLNGRKKNDYDDNNNNDKLKSEGEYLNRKKIELKK